jgi:hypothetical protein
MLPSQPKVEAFLSALKEQSFFKDETVQGSVLWYIDFYKKHAPRSRVKFRASGFVLLFLSISLPFIIQVSPRDLQAPIASALAWFIALIAAASSFFNWQKAWQLYTQTQLALQAALSEWELRTVEARAVATDEEGMKILQDALQKLTRTVSESVSNETAQYFEGVKMPDVQAKSAS